MMKEAMFYKKSKGGGVDCSLCARCCRNIRDGCAGFCGVRKNEGGKLYSLVYGRACSVAVDPIEKKPLFHFAPGTMCLSLATVGCNLKCLHCQNWQISQEYGGVYGTDMPPEKIVEHAKRQGVKGISYTYTEPTIFYEYALDTMKLAKKAGLYNVWVSNGYTTPQAIKGMAKYLDAINVDIKGNDEFYRKVCMAPGIKPVYDALIEYKKAGVWIEITNLVIPGHNDKEKDVKAMVRWIKTKLGADTPLHFSAFYPNYKLRSAKPTPPETLEKCYEIAKKGGLRWIYLGNIRSGHTSTFCRKCGEKVIDRYIHRVMSYADRCPKCGTEIPVAGKKWVKK